MHNFVYLHQNTDFSMITNSPSLDLVEFYHDMQTLTVPTIWSM